jgi:hypothetical protein
MKVIWIIIGIVLLVIILLVIVQLVIIPLVIIPLVIKKKDDKWKISFLREIYPLGTNLNSSQYDELTCLYSDLLPDSEKDRLKASAYTAALPGPSCFELPCPCDKDGVPDVGFAPNPILDNKWPPCNVKGAKGQKCCASVSAYKKCLQEEPDAVPWVANDTWDGNEINAKQGPPKFGQVWKPSLWPKYCLSVSKYNPKNWNSFKGAKGVPDNTWIEGLHSSFSITNTTFGVWFYHVKGSGIFVNLGKTLRALNKLDAIIKLGYTFEDIADFIFRDKIGILIGLKDEFGVLNQDPLRTGLGGIENLEYWLNGQVADAPDVSKTKLVSMLKEAAYGTDYNLNRINNTGVLDSLFTHLAQSQGYNSVQFTVQSNLYTGWTIEIMILGSDPRGIYTSVNQIPKNQIRVLDPNNLPKLTTTDKGKACNFIKTPSCTYCDALPASKNRAMNCTEDISKWKECEP